MLRSTVINKVIKNSELFDQDIGIPETKRTCSSGGTNSLFASADLAG
jgi:hypothetical protein